MEGPWSPKLRNILVSLEVYHTIILLLPRSYHLVFTQNIGFVEKKDELVGEWVSLTPTVARVTL